ncbi:MAG TPA: tetratricopeptide repeat protein [Candidatus Binataceae bacterium]|jgi:Tfp pilus assembly protein PilF|nr:tetratricopeptide repeat protein [Candidatus Binataceae bacterium]
MPKALRACRYALGLAVIAAVAVSGCGRKSVDDYIQAGDQARQNGQLAQAEVDYQDAIKAAPTDARPHLALGELYAFEKKSDAARGEFVNALELAPKSAATHAAVAGAYADQGQLGAAEDQYRAAVALEPANPAYRLALGEVLARGQHNGPAEAELRTAVGLDPKNAHMHLALAQLLDTEPNRQADAQAEYTEVKLLDPSLLASVPTPVTAATPAAVATAAAPANIRILDKKFLLTHDSPVFEAPSNGSPVVAQVHHGRLVHVTGITGDWLRVRLKTGVVGFIPTNAAE